MSEKNAPGHDSGSEALTETPEVPAVPEVAGTPVRPELRLEVIADAHRPVRRLRRR